MRIVSERAERLDKFLARMLPEHSRTKLARMAADGQVIVEGKPQKASFEVQPGMTVELPTPASAPPHDLTPADIPLNIVYEDEFLLAVDKPRGLAVHPAPSLKEPSMVNALLSRQSTLSTVGGEFRPGIVHRLDKETTGLILVAKTDSVHARLAAAIASKETVRRYVAVVAGNPQHEQFTVSAPIARSRHNRLAMAVDPKGKAAVTHFKSLGSVEAGTVLMAALETGRTHQIRVHLQSIGHPVLGDRLYAPKRYQGLPLQLHAAFLRFRHPVTERVVELFARPPEDFVGWELVREESLAHFEPAAF